MIKSKSPFCFSFGPIWIGSCVEERLIGVQGRGRGQADPLWYRYQDLGERREPGVFGLVSGVGEDTLEIL